MTSKQQGLNYSLAVSRSSRLEVHCFNEEFSDLA